MIAGLQRKLLVFLDFRRVTAVDVHSQILALSLDFHFTIIHRRGITGITIRTVAPAPSPPWVKWLNDDYPPSNLRRSSRRSAKQKSSNQQNRQYLRNPPHSPPH